MPYTKKRLKVMKIALELEIRFTVTPVSDFPEAGDMNEINRLVFIHVFGMPPDRIVGPPQSSGWFYEWIPSGQPPKTHMLESKMIPMFASEASAALVMERKLEERGLRDAYVGELWRLLYPELEMVEATTFEQMFRLTHALPYHKAIAALRACCFPPAKETTDAS